MTTQQIVYMSNNYKLLRDLIKTHFKFVLIAYPGSTTPRLKIMSDTGLTIMYGAYNTVIAFIINLLNKELIDYTLETDDD